MIGAYYQAYKRPKCVKFVLENYRNHYPDTDIVLVSDGGDDFSDIAKQYNCQYFYEENLSGPSSDKSKGLASNYFHNENILLNYALRFGKYIQKIKNEQFMILEDDVYVINKTNNLPYDLNGINLTESLPESVCMDFKNIKRIPYGACGGCILNTNFFKQIFSEKNIQNIIKQVKKYCSLTNEKWASDAIISYLCFVNNGTSGVWNGLGETWQTNLIDRINKGEIDVIHQYKVYY